MHIMTRLFRPIPNSCDIINCLTCGSFAINDIDFIGLEKKNC